VVCLHEEDAGISWKHVEYRTGESEVRRSRKLVLSFIATVVNYEYAFYWSFHPDGTFQLEIKATGELSTNLLPPGEKPEYGTLVAPQVNAQNHQHMFNVRLVPMIDGSNNSVSEIEVERLPPHGSQQNETQTSVFNPYRNGFITKSTLISNEKIGKRFGNTMMGRHWRIFNPKILHPVTGEPVSWKILPMTPTTELMAAPDSWIARRAEFSTANLWVTKFDEKEKYPAGDYPNQSPGGDGVGKWIQKNRNLENEEICLWYTMGLLHIPRPEDFPVMPMEICGFVLKPFGFFEMNPAVDLPTFKKNCNANRCTQSNL